MINFQQEREDKIKEVKAIEEKITIKENIKTEKVQAHYKLRRDYNGEDFIEIGQGSGHISKDNLPLISDGFTKCQALILKNNTTGKIGLLHIEPSGDLTSTQAKIFSEIDENFDYMNQKKFTDNIDVCILCREDRTFVPLYEYCNRRKYNIKAIEVMPGIDKRRGVIYDPRINNIIIHTREEGDDKLTYYKGFDQHKKDKIAEKTQNTLHKNMVNI